MHPASSRNLDGMSQQSLEQDIIEWIAERTTDYSLRAQCRAANTVSRSFSGAGSFTQLRTSGDAPSSSLSRSDVDPAIKSPELPLDGGCVLFLKGGRIDLLEIYVHGSDPYPDDIEKYELLEK